VIPPETIATIKERTDIVALIGESVKLSRSGRSFKGLCPFHKEKSGSFYVHPDRGFYHCFGCGESGSAIDFVMKQNGLDFREAAVLLAERAGVTIEETREKRPERTGPTKDDVYGVNNIAAAFFEHELGLARTGPKGNPLARHALAELKKRGMPSLSDESDEARQWQNTLAAFRVGYAPAEWDGLASYLKRQGVSAEVAERAGLLVPRSNGSGHYDRFRHRLMFAVMDTLGRVVAFSGRALAAPSADELGPNAPSYDGPEPPAKYLNSPESPVYTKGHQLFGLYQAKRAMRERGEAILVEGNFDVVSLHAAGFEHTVAPLGTAFTIDQAKLLKRFVPRVVIAFDGDGAGAKATRASRGPCTEGGLEGRVAQMPKGLDPDELVRTQGRAALANLVKNARGMLEHLINDALDGDAFAASTLSEQNARVRAVAKLISDENEPTLRLMAKSYADRLSSQLVQQGRAPEDLSQLERLIGQAVSGKDREAPAPREAQRTLPAAEAAIVGALFDFPSLLDDRRVENGLGLLQGESALAVVALRQHVRAHSQKVDPEVLLASLPRSIHSFAAQRLASPRFEADSSARTHLLENLEKLEATSRKREVAAAVMTLEKGSGTLPFDAQAEILRELAAKRKRTFDE